jgi:hypothetical protein
MNCSQSLWSIVNTAESVSQGSSTQKKTAAKHYFTAIKTNEVQDNYLLNDQSVAALSLG